MIFSGLKLSNHSIGQCNPWLYKIKRLVDINIFKVMKRLFSSTILKLCSIIICFSSSWKQRWSKLKRVSVCYTSCTKYGARSILYQVWRVQSHTVAPSEQCVSSNPYRLSKLSYTYPLAFTLSSWNCRWVFQLPCGTSTCILLILFRI